MKFYKKGMSTLLWGLVGFAILAIIVFSLLGFVKKGFTEGPASGLLNFMKKKAGIDSKESEKQKEENRMANDLYANAELAFTQFKGDIGKCINQEGYAYDRLCICASFDFTKLNNYALKLSNSGGAQILELLDAASVPVKDKQENLGSFNIGPIDLTNTRLNYGRSDSYSNPSIITERVKLFNSNFVTFSKDAVTFNKGGNNNIKKSEGKTTRINFIKVGEDTIVVDENDNGFRKCGTDIDCLKWYAYYYPSSSEYEEKTGNLPSSKFEICQNMYANYCYSYNNQYIQKTDECKKDKVKTEQKPLGCSITELKLGDPITDSGLKDNFERKSYGKSEALSKFQYVFDIKNLLKGESLNDLNLIMSNINGLGLNARIYVTSTLEPFSAGDDDKISSFTRQIFKDYKENDVGIVIAINDGIAEMIYGSGEKSRQRFTNLDTCVNFLKQFTGLISKDIKRRNEQKEKANLFFSNLVNGYDDCIKQNQINGLKAQGIENACNCGTTVSLDVLYDYKVDFEYQKSSQGNTITKLKLKNLKNQEIQSGQIDKMFKPCARTQTNFPLNCPVSGFDLDTLKYYSTDKATLKLAKGTITIGENKFDVVFFGDDELPKCA